MDNPDNILITKDQVEDILNYFGPIGNDNQRLKIKTLDYYQTAFVHESYYQVQQQNLDKDMPVYVNYIASTKWQWSFLGNISQNKYNYQPLTRQFFSHP